MDTSPRRGRAYWGRAYWQREGRWTFNSKSNSKSNSKLAVYTTVTKLLYLSLLFILRQLHGMMSCMVNLYMRDRAGWVWTKCKH
jgi:hypothetical protein